MATTSFNDASPRGRVKIFKPEPGNYIVLTNYEKYKSIFWTGIPVTSRFSICSLPYAVEIERNEQNKETYVSMVKWVEDHTQYEWTIRMEDRDSDTGNPNYYIFQFSDLNDATLFRLTWC